MSSAMMKGPGGRGSAMMAPRPKIKKGTLKRVLSYVWKNYKGKFVVVLVCIILSSIANVLGILSLKTVIDDFITPLIGMQNPNYSGLVEF